MSVRVGTRTSVSGTDTPGFWISPDGILPLPARSKVRLDALGGDCDQVEGVGCRSNKTGAVDAFRMTFDIGAASKTACIEEATPPTLPSSRISFVTGIFTASLWLGRRKGDAATGLRSRNIEISQTAAAPQPTATQSKT